MRNLKSYDEFLNESRSAYDSTASLLTRETIKHWVKDWKGGSKKSEFEYSIDDKLDFELSATIYFDSKYKGFEILSSTGANSDDIDMDGDYTTPYIIIEFGINPDWLPGYWQEIYMHFVDTMRHEIEHITQGGSYNYKAGKPDEDDQLMRQLIKSKMLPYHTYLTLPKEVDANLQGLRLESKKRKESMKDSVDRYLNTQEFLTPETREEVLEVWRRRAKKIGGIPKF